VNEDAAVQAVGWLWGIWGVQCTYYQGDRAGLVARAGMVFRASECCSGENEVLEVCSTRENDEVGKNEVRGACSTRGNDEVGKNEVRGACSTRGSDVLRVGNGGQLYFTI
jgi:hypothetical protein